MSDFDQELEQGGGKRHQIKLVVLPKITIQPIDTKKNIENKRKEDKGRKSNTKQILQIKNEEVKIIRRIINNKLKSRQAGHRDRDGQRTNDLREMTRIQSQLKKIREAKDKPN